MKMGVTHNRYTTGPHLSQEELQLLLANDEASQPFAAAVRHLDSCEACQSQLTALASETDLWNEAQSLLRGKSQPRWEPDMSQSLVLKPTR